jgi:hypothetical protein
MISNLIGQVQLNLLQPLQLKRFVILNDRMRQVPLMQLRDTATYKYHRYGEIHKGMMSERAYQDYYRYKFTKMKTPVGGYSLLLMPEQLRTFIGPKTNIPTTASADVLRANAAIQQWYGENSLPAEPYVVQAGTNLSDQSMGEPMAGWMRNRRFS